MQAAQYPVEPNNLLNSEIEQFVEMKIFLPQVISFTEEEISLCVQGVSDLSKATITTPALETVLVPVHLQRLELTFN